MKKKILTFLSSRIVRNLAFMFTAMMTADFFIRSNFVTDDLDSFEKERLLWALFWLLVTVFINPFYNLWRQK